MFSDILYLSVFHRKIFFTVSCCKHADNILIILEHCYFFNEVLTINFKYGKLKISEFK